MAEGLDIGGPSEVGVGKNLKGRGKPKQVRMMPGRERGISDGQGGKPEIGFVSVCNGWLGVGWETGRKAIREIRLARGARFGWDCPASCRWEP